MATEIIVFQIGAMIFAASSVVFLFGGTKKLMFDTEFFISFITSTSYVVMSLAIATTVALGGGTIYWSRWLFYMAACPLLMYDVVRISTTSHQEYPKFVLLTCLTMFNGFLASFIVTSSRWIFFLFGSAAFIGLLYMVSRGQENRASKTLKPFVYIGWSLFPVVFLLAPTGFGIFDAPVTAFLYLLLDIVTKLWFGIITIRMK
ncbi:MAG: bacteriorhodopsin [Methanomicrobiaceae archaeon]|nr:bacteriorhodopsin [Methanomicrobiaceae archaeon]